MTKAFLCILALFFLPYHLLAQSFQLTHIGVEEGLPSSEVYCALQDQQGFMWFGTDRGAARFDGEEFLQIGSRNGLHNEAVFEICEDKWGRVWFGTFSPLLSYFYQGQVQDFAHNDALFAFENRTSPKSGLLVTDAGDVYLATHTKGLLHVDPTGKVSRIDPKRRGICHMVGDQVLLSVNSTSAIGLEIPSEYIFSSGRGPNITITPLEGGDMYTADCLQGPSGAWYFSMGRQLLKIHEGQVVWRKLLDHSSNRVMVDEMERIWICWRGGKMTVLDKDGEPLPWKFPQLDGKTLSSVFKDREGGHWFTTIGDGVFYLPSMTFPYWSPLSQNHQSDPVQVQVVSDSSLFYALSNGLVGSLAIRSSGHWETESLFSISSRPKIHWNPSDKSLWAIGLSLFSLDSAGFLREHPYEISGLGSALIFDRSGGIYMGTSRRSYYLQAGTANLKAMSDQRVFSMGIDRKGRCWMGDLEGLWVRENGKWERPPEIHPVTRQRISDLAFLPDGRIACATAGSGLVVLGDGKVEVYGLEEGMLSMVVNAIAVDQRGNVWAGGNRGLQQVDVSGPKPGAVRGFDARHGMPFLEINQVEVGDSLVWFGGPDGISQLNRLHLPQASTPPPVFFNAFLINGQSRPLQTGFELDHHETDLQIGFQSLHFRTGKKLQYRYRMLGLEQAWRHTQDRKVNYSGLAPGSYTFEVAAPNEDGEWGPISRLHISISPPIWTRWWFISGGILLGFLLIGLVAGYFFRQWRRRLQSEKALEEWKLKALQAQINPHFTFNTLNTIQAYITTHDTLSAELYLNKFARLIRLVMQQSQESWVALEEEIELLTLYLDLNQMRFEEAFTYELKVEQGISVSQVQVPPMMVQPFVENAVLHGLLPKTGQGHLEISFAEKAGEICCRILDNGIGRKAAQQKKANAKPGHRSRGMGLVSAQLDHLTGSRGERLQVEDLHDAEGKPAGTRVELLIPTQKA